MIVHRDYRDSGDSIIKIFDDRIEFFNPGKLYDDITIEKLLSGNYSSRSRNRAIAKIFKEAGIIEKYGSGITRIRKECKAHEIKEPIFEEFQHGFRVIVFKEKTTPIATPITIPMTTKDRLLYLIKENPKITRDNLANNLGISINTVKEYILKLKKEKKLERVGDNRNGYWKVIE